MIKKLNLTLISITTIMMVCAGALASQDSALFPLATVATAAWAVSLVFMSFFHWIDRRRDDEIKTALEPMQARLNEMGKRLDSLQRSRIG